MLSRGSELDQSQESILKKLSAFADEQRRENETNTVLFEKVCP